MFVFLKVMVPYISGTIMDVEYIDYDNYTADIDSNLTTEGTLNLYIFFNLCSGGSQHHHMCFGACRKFPGDLDLWMENENHSHHHLVHQPGHFKPFVLCLVAFRSCVHDNFTLALWRRLVQARLIRPVSQHAQQCVPVGYHQH